MLTIALIGRTNVGKSTLFNRIVGESRAMVSALPQTTRDRNVGTTMWRGVPLRVIDTGGIEEVRGQRSEVRSIENEIRKQVEIAIADADLLVLVTDVRDGLLPGEQRISRYLRTLGKPIIVVCNKVSTARLRMACQEFSALGLGNVFPIAAVTGAGVGDLLDRIITFHPPSPPLPRGGGENNFSPSALEGERVGVGTPTNIKVAIVGEPNVGKSSLLNAVLGREEVIVLPEPFTTRDVHDVDIERDGRTITLLDTAGIRRLAVQAVRYSKTRLQAIERMAVRRSLSAIERSDVVVLVLDATRPATRHTKQLADAIVADGRACIIVVNKSDLLTSAAPDMLAARIHRLFPHLRWSLVLTTSALHRVGTDTVLPAAVRASISWRRLLSANDLSAIHATVKSRIPASRTADGRKRSHLVELKQLDTTPPRFLLLTRRRVKLPKAIPAIVERAIREHADFAGTPISITIKSIKV